MSEPFLSEIRIMSFNFAPRGWALCNGALLPIAQNRDLFALLKNTFGGDGNVNFALPNLQGRTPIHVGNGHTLGQAGGEAAHTLTSAELPTHFHTAQGSTANANSSTPENAVMTQRPTQAYHAPTNMVKLAPQSLAEVGESRPHENMQQYLALNFCIALQGITPRRN